MSNHPLGEISRASTIACLIGSMVTLLAPSAWAEQPGDVLKLRQTRNCVDCNLRKANLENASLMGAFLRETNLKEANLEGADLRFAIIRNVNLKNANLSNANLTGAILRDVNLEGANLTGAQLPIGFRNSAPANAGQDSLIPAVRDSLIQEVEIRVPEVVPVPQ